MITRVLDARPVLLSHTASLRKLTLIPDQLDCMPMANLLTMAVSPLAFATVTLKWVAGTFSDRADV
jgi:hypothetical protein